MSEERATAWEIMRDFFQDKKKPQELMVFNPLQLKIGDFVFVDTEQLFEKQLVVTEIDEYSTFVGEKKFTHVDFILETDDGKTVTLRLNPVANTDPYAKKHCDMLVLFPDVEMEYDENFHQNTLPTGTLEVKDGDVVIATYQRTGENKNSFAATVKAVDRPNQPPKTEKFSYWDYVRDVEGEQEFYFVEMSEETGWFQTFRGVPVFEESVRVLKKKVDA